MFSLWLSCIVVVVRLTVICIRTQCYYVCGQFPYKRDIGIFKNILGKSFFGGGNILLNIS
jgi:hypothetical protein